MDVRKKTTIHTKMNETKITREYLKKGFENWKFLLKEIRTVEERKHPLEVKFSTHYAQLNPGVYEGRIQASMVLSSAGDKSNMIPTFNVYGTDERLLISFLDYLLNKLIEGDREDKTYLFAVEKIYGISPAEIQEES